MQKPYKSMPLPQSRPYGNVNKENVANSDPQNRSTTSPTWYRPGGEQIMTPKKSQNMGR